MFEEIAVWRRIDEGIAVRYVGFRDLEKDRVCIAFGNWVGSDVSPDLTADEMIAPQSTLDDLLDLPSADSELWQATISEALAVFLAANPD